MRETTLLTKILFLLSSVITIAVSARAEEPVYPVKVSSNGRYFVDQEGKPVFWLGTTQWQLFRDYTLDDARLIIEKSKDHGFVFIQVMLMGVGDGTKTNGRGQTVEKALSFSLTFRGDATKRTANLMDDEP